MLQHFTKNMFYTFLFCATIYSVAVCYNSNDFQSLDNNIDDQPTMSFVYSSWMTVSLSTANILMSIPNSIVDFPSDMANYIATHIPFISLHLQQIIFILLSAIFYLICTIGFVNAFSDMSYIIY